MPRDETFEDALQRWATGEPESPPGYTWVTLAQAEQASGASRSALRSWYRSGQLASELVEGPHGPQRLVPLEAVLERVNQSARLRRKLEQDALADVAARLAAAEAGLRRLSARVAELEHLLGL